MEKSKKYRLNKTDAPALGKAVGVGIALAAVTFVTDFLVGGNIDFGSYTEIIAGLAPVIAMLIKRAITDNTKGSK